MAIAYDTHSTPGVVADNTTQQWTHTPIGVPKGALCLVAEDNNSGSSTVVRYNGVTMPNSPSSPTELDSAQDSTLRAHFLGASLPSGSVTVEISGNGGGSFWYPVLITMTALGDTEIVSDAVAQQSPAGATLAVGGVEVFAAEVFARTTGLDDLRPGWSVIAQATITPFTAFIATQSGSSDMAIGGTMGASSTHVLAVAMRDTDAGGSPGGGTLAADPAAFTVTGHDAGLLAHRRVVAEPAAFALSGHDADLLRHRRLAADPSAYAIDGHDAALRASRRLTAEAVAFALTGHDAELVYAAITGYTLTAETGTFAVTGHDAGFQLARRLLAESAAFTLTGVDALLLRGLRLSADTGLFSLSGHDAALLASRVLRAETGAFTVLGVAADLDWSGAPSLVRDRFIITLVAPRTHRAELTAPTKLAARLRAPTTFNARLVAGLQATPTLEI